MSRNSKGSINKELLNKYFEDKLTVDTISSLTNFSFKTISKYYQMYLKNNKNEINKERLKTITNLEEHKEVRVKKKNIYCNNHIVRPDSLENCKHIIKVKENEIKYINMKFNRIVKKVIALENENEKLLQKNIKLTNELNKRKETLKIY